MTIDDKIKQRFEELESALNNLKWKYSEHSGRYLANDSSSQWLTSVSSLFEQVFGRESTHYEQLHKCWNDFHGHDYEFDKALGVFRAAKEDYLGGYLFRLSASISGEVYGDFVVLAKNALDEGYKDVAAVLACAALEDALKRYAQSNGLDITDKSMSDVVNTLKSKGMVQGAQKTLLDTMPRLRNYAMHANWEKISPEDSAGILGFVEKFILEKF